MISGWKPKCMLVCFNKLAVCTFACWFVNCECQPGECKQASRCLRWALHQIVPLNHHLFWNNHNGGDVVLRASTARKLQDEEFGTKRMKPQLKKVDLRPRMLVCCFQQTYERQERTKCDVDFWTVCIDHTCSLPPPTTKHSSENNKPKKKKLGRQALLWQLF